MIKKTFFILMLIILNCCASVDYNPESAEEYFVYVKKFYEKGEYDQAIKKMREFQVTFPYSKYVAEGDLLIANSYFELGDFIEAAFSYSQFIKLHPKNKNVIYAMYRLGESYWQQAPEEIDREQKNTKIAIQKWGNLIETYPDSEFSTKATKLIEKGYLRMVEADLFVAKYYCNKQIWYACAYRFLKIIEEYPQYKEIMQKANLQAARAIEKLVANKDKEKSVDNVFFKDYSDEQLLEKAKQLRNTF